MSIGTLIKTIQDIMRKDVGVDGDAQRISQLTWLLFLKVFDALEEELEGDRKNGTAGVLGALKAYMCDASSITIGQTVLATWKAQTAQRLDTNALKAAMPDIYAQFLKPSESRVFRIK
jgi:type I restriction-modification system DNA methylase subunit